MKRIILHIFLLTNILGLDVNALAQIPTQEQCQQADAQLNQVYQQLRGTLNDAQKQQLKQAQRDWIKKRDAFVAANPGNPQGALYQATMQRVNELKKLEQQRSGSYSRQGDSSRRVDAVNQVTSPGQSDSAQEAKKVYAKAMALSEKRDYAKALPLFESALAFCGKVYGPEHSVTAGVLNNLASSYIEMGNCAKAIPLYERALVIREKVQGLEHLETAFALHNLASSYIEMGNCAKAIPLYERALAICEKVQGPDHPDTALMLNGMAYNYSKMGNYAKAIPNVERALAIREKVQGPEHPETVLSLNNLAADYRAMGNYKKSLPLYERLLSTSEKVQGPEDPQTASILDNLAGYYCALGNDEKALPLLERVLAIRKKVLGPNHPETASALYCLGGYYWSMGNYEKALPLTEKALAICEKVLGQEHPMTLQKYQGLAAEHYMMGSDLLMIREPLAKLYSGKEKSLESILTMDEATRLAWEQDNLQLPLIDLLKGEQRCQFILRTKGIVLDSIVEDQAAIKMLGEDSLEANEIASARQRIAQLAFSTKKEYKEEVSRLKARIDAILSNTAGQRVKVGQARKSAGITPDVIAVALPKGTMLVDFVQFRDQKIKRDGDLCYGALMIGPDGESKFVRINDATGIDASVHALRGAITKGDEKALVDHQKILSMKLWAPVANNLPEGTKKLFIGADGQLNFLSFAALPAADGGFLAEHYDIAYVGSGRDLARRVTLSDSKSIALFADPVFDRQALAFSTNALALRSGEVDAFGKIILPPLPGTRAEESAVEKVATANGWTPQARLGEAASKPSIMNLKSPGILHLATHGFYLNTLPQSGEGERGMKVVQTAAEFEGKPTPPPKIDPMHASGIALTGAQATLKAWSEGRVPDPKDDGILTAQEVGALNLDGTWLVTLSACDTGVGEARSGEGVFGLRRAFMIAGAQNLLMTLWPVSDEVTPKIMADFYKEALATHDAPGSLAKVQRDWLVKLRKEKGLLAAVRDAGPFAMVVMANPNAKPMPEYSSASTPEPTPEMASAKVSAGESVSTSLRAPAGSPEGGNIMEFSDALAKADAGDAKAQAIVSIYYALGYKADKDLAKAAEYASKSAAQNNPLGQYQLGVLTSGGDGVSKDLEKGKELKVQSIESLNTMADDPYALAALGAMALRGEGVAKDMKKAAKLYKKSADLGYAPAQVLYSMMLTKGVGVSPDASAARKYASMAEAQNYHP